MNTYTLRQSTGNTYVNDICMGLIELITCVFPDHAFSLYIQGSYAEQQATDLSDLDLVV